MTAVLSISARPFSPLLPLSSSPPSPPRPSDDGSPLPELLARLLPADSEWYTPTQIAALFGLTPRAVMHHCRELWPDWEGQYRLDQNQALRLIRRIVWAGRRVPSRDQVLAQLERKEQTN